MSNDTTRVYVTEPLDEFMDVLEPLRGNGRELLLGPAHSRADLVVPEADLCAADASALIGMAREKITGPVIAANENLSVICKFGTGVDNIDVDAATKAGVLVTNTPVHVGTVAEYAFTLLLACLRRLRPNIDHVRAGGWREPSTQGSELAGKTVGVVGFGGIGKEFVRRLQGWDVTVLIHDPAADPREIATLGHEPVDLMDLLRRSDIVSLHVPLVPATHHLIGREQVAAMRPGSLLINTSRGPVVDEQAVLAALESGRLSSFGTDVFEVEPPSTDHPLLALDNVVATPHVAGSTAESLRRIVEQAVRNAVDALEGREPTYVVNPGAIDAWRRRWAH